MKSSSENSYRQILKANALFGGLQLYQILIQVIRSKFIAVLLGPVGVGIMGLYTSAIKLISDISSMGLSQSAVRDLSESFGTGNMQRVSLTIKVVRRLIWITGLIGAMAVIVLSPVLSKASFGNTDYTIPFIFLSVTLLLDQLCAGQKVLLQGTRKLKDLAKATAIGSTIGLFVSIPLYYLMGVDGIVPTMILYSLTSLLLSWYFSKRIKVFKVDITYKNAFKEGMGMLKLGMALCLSSILVSACSYILRSYISGIGGIVDVGLYVAGAAIVNNYVGMVFTAISTDYYPRLASVNKDNEKCKVLVNEQGEIATLILTPLLTICVVFMPIAIRILYSDEFMGANDYIVWAVCGMLFKLVSWVVGFMFVAKSESKLFAANEFSVSVYGLILAILGYTAMGIEGIGISFLIKFIIYAIVTYMIAHKRYGFTFSSSFCKIFIIQLSFICVCLIVTLLSDNTIFNYILGSMIIICSVIYSFKGLNSRTSILTYVKERIHNRRKRSY